MSNPTTPAVKANQTIVLIAFFVLVLVCLVGVVVLLLIAPAQLTPYMVSVTAILAIASAAAINLGGLAKQGDQIAQNTELVQTVQKQTNGTTTALTNQIAELVAHLANSTPAPSTVTTPITIQSPQPDGGRHALV